MNFNFFKGRYGIDTLTKFLGIVGLFFLVSKGYIKIFGLLILGYATWRCYSMDFNKRRREDMIFQEWLRKLNFSLKNVKYKFNNILKGLKDKKNYKIVKCPDCNQMLRLPRGKGKIIVTCRKCSKEFKIKS